MVPGFCRPILLCLDGMPLASGIMCEMGMRHFDNPNLSVVVAKCWYLWCVVLDRTSTIPVCIATLTLDDRIYECLLTTMAAVQAVDVRASFLFMGDVNIHHQEWLVLLI